MHLYCITITDFDFVADIWPQEIAAAMAKPQAALADVRKGYESLVAYFGENSAAAPPDTEFWEAIVCKFVRALNEQQLAQLRSQQASTVPRLKLIKA
jgi:hypothetical protein